MSSTSSMSTEQAAFRRAELERTPRDFSALSTKDIDVELARRWEAHNAPCDTFMDEVKMSDAEAALNRVIYCGAVDRSGTMHHIYKPFALPTAPAEAAGKRKRRDVEENGPSSSSGSVSLELFLGNPKITKDTLQRICDDLGLHISGNKPELIMRIVENDA